MATRRQQERDISSCARQNFWQDSLQALQRLFQTFYRVSPEIRFLDVLSNGSLYDVLRGIAAGEPKKFLVLWQKPRAFGLEDGVEATAQQIAERVGKVIKGEAGDVEM
jgi:hypothetical protein